MAGLDIRRQRPPLPALFREAVTGLPLGEAKAAQTFLDLLVEALRSADASSKAEREEQGDAEPSLAPSPVCEGRTPDTNQAG
jgi:hypothetical protein